MIENEIIRYAYLKNTTSLKVGAKIAKGETIGTMSFTENENLVEVILYESTNGKNCETKNINKKTVDPSLYLEYQEVPEPDYLHYPMAASLDTSISDSVSGRLAMIVGGDEKSPIMSYIYNEDLGNVKKESAIERSLSVTSNTADENIPNSVSSEFSYDYYLLSHIKREVYDIARIFKKEIEWEKIESSGILTFDKSTKIATVKLNGREVKYGESLGNAKIIDEKMMINANELYKDILLEYIEVNGEKYQINFTNKNEVLNFLKSFDSNARLEGLTKNTINVYNYKTKTSVKYEYKMSMSIVDILTKSGFINAKTGSACYTKNSSSEYTITAKNIFTHHLGLAEIDICNKMKVFSIDDILFIDKINNLDSNFDGLQVFYIFENYSENESTKLFLDMNFSSSVYVNFKKSYDSTHIGYISSNLYGIELEAFIKTRSELVDSIYKKFLHFNN